jgi:ABC-type ATPase involved in cell division
VHWPPVLFQDEPTTGLDLQSRNELWAMIRDLVVEGTTVQLTMQYLDHRTWVRRPAGRRVACNEAVGPPCLQVTDRGISAAGGTMR